MNKDILNIEVQTFINNNINIEATSLILKGSPFLNVPSKELASQIISKNKCRKKLPTWFNTPNIYYPNKLSIEQTSSEITAQYKSDLAQGNTLLDLSGGFGVDSYYFSKKNYKVTHCEIDEELHEIVKHNFKILKADINTINNDGITYLKSVTHFNWIYIDPSRRHDTKGKVFFLKDCEPNIPENIDLLLAKTSNILIKTSPLLDIKAGIKELKFVKEVHSIAVNNEVKELLWVIEKDYVSEIKLKAVNIKKNNEEHFESILDDDINHKPECNKPLTYLYEPNVAIMKIGVFNSIAIYYGLSKLDLHTHLYTSEKYNESFPGRSFKILNVLPYSKKELKTFKNIKANITTRNFPLSVKEIKKKLKITDGGDTYLFFTTSEGKKFIIVTEKCS